jgi:hypothetical protein
MAGPFTPNGHTITKRKSKATLMVDAEIKAIKGVLLSPKAHSTTVAMLYSGAKGMPEMVISK